MKKIIGRSILTGMLAVLIAGCQPAPPPDEGTFISEQEKILISREIKRRGIQSPASIERTETGFILRELGSGKIYKIRNHQGRQSS